LITQESKEKYISPSDPGKVVVETILIIIITIITTLIQAKIDQHITMILSNKMSLNAHKKDTQQ